MLVHSIDFVAMNDEIFWENYVEALFGVIEFPSVHVC
jgi:hypothetical protein